MKSFSQRKGLIPVSELIQVDSMSDALRNSLWNVLHERIWSRPGFMYKQYGTAGMDAFSHDLWFHYYKEPIDTRPAHSTTVLSHIRQLFFRSQWNEVYDFIEFVVNRFDGEVFALEESLNLILERELSGFRLVSRCVVDITDSQEVAMIEESLRDSEFAGVTAHLRRSLELLASREHPDYRNSIKESISAVEAMARIITGDQKATLGEALKALEKGGQLHTALKDGFSKLYGYTSDSQGIRHSMLEEPSISASDAKYFLLSCTSFVNYLKAQM